MENPDAMVEFKRDKQGNILEITFKVYVPGKDDRNGPMLSEMVANVLASEGPEDHSTQIDVNVDFPIS
jgi:hypothetical protein